MEDIFTAEKTSQRFLSPDRCLYCNLPPNWELLLLNLLSYSHIQLLTLKLSLLFSSHGFSVSF